ncbi:MAG: gliding motility-associated C-terminal domain-containing protein [Bacteroidetes bacterium]|nr:gliding motility-associated C-terminal domain-containing protein [Bacteroidota bacterium]
MKKYILTLVITFFSISLFSQTYLISSGGTVNTCAGDFFDSGGSGGNYGVNENFTMTFHSPNTPNTHIRMNFNIFDIDPSDTLYIYDGPSIASPLLGAYNNTNPLAGTAVQASLSNVSGDLTFRFKSNGVTENSGWFASLVCVPMCQQILAAIDTLVCHPLPNDSGYIDICHGDTITFAALGFGPGVFPQNNTLYMQDAASSLFIWDFGDGVKDTGLVINHYYSGIHGYDISLSVIDSHGCTNTNYLPLRVRVSGNPIGAVNGLENMCPRTDTVTINVGYNPTDVIQVVPITSAQSSSQSFDSTMFIPDGPACSVQCYNTDVTFTCFNPGQTVTSAADVESICVNMEHSYVGDLGFTIFCPNGQNVVLDPNTHSGGLYFGVPLDMAPYDNGCIPADNVPGTGWTYCWSEIYPQVGTLDALCNSGSGTTLDSTNQIVHSGYITPENPLSGLIGCPLNGTWNIRICDDFGSDNGYIFNWTLNLSANLLPANWSYSVPIDSIGWSGAFIETTTDSSITVVPDSGGVYTYTVTVYDHFGCAYDTTLSVIVFPKTEVDAGLDQIICSGQSTSVFAGSSPAATSYTWNTTPPQSTQSINVTPTVATDYSVTVTDINGCIGYDTVKVNLGNNPTALINGPTDQCLNDVNFVGTGSTVNPPDVITSYFWDFGDLSTGTLSNPTHIYPIPGTYNIQLIVNTANGCADTINHTVTIHPPITIYVGQDTIVSEGITVPITANVAGYTYNWSNGGNTQTIYASQPGTYSVTVTDEFGCTAKDEMVIYPSEIVIPNVITPNGDSFNQFFHITNLYQYPNSKMVIYNRWGKKVFEDSNYQNTWDGDKCSDGVYFYVLELSSGTNYHGSLTIIN